MKKKGLDVRNTGDRVGVVKQVALLSASQAMFPFQVRRGKESKKSVSKSAFLSCKSEQRSSMSFHAQKWYAK